MRSIPIPVAVSTGSPRRQNVIIGDIEALICQRQGFAGRCDWIRKHAEWASGPRILVTGASGNIGGGRHAATCRRVPVRALSRNPQSGNLPVGIDVVRGDLTAPDTLDRAWTMSPPCSSCGSRRSRPQQMRSHESRREPNASSFFPLRFDTAHPFFQQPNPLRTVHAGVEELIEKSGARWTFLRPGPFALNCLNWWAPQIRSGDAVRWFHGSATAAPSMSTISGRSRFARCATKHDGRTTC